MKDYFAKKVLITFCIERARAIQLKMLMKEATVGCQYRMFIQLGALNVIALSLLKLFGTIVIHI